MDGYVEVTVVGSEAEAELLVGLLADAGIAAEHVDTDVGAAQSLGLGGGGPRAVFVPESDLVRAREVLAAAGSADAR